jgi:DNA-binding response OmpR family regulator
MIALPPTPSSASTLSRVLFVSDDLVLATRLTDLLHGAGLALDPTGLTGGATAPLRADRHRAAVIDLRDNPSRGIAALECLRHHTRELPLLALVARGGKLVPEQALDIGADDFCCGTDHPEELLVRLQRLTRRPTPTAGARGLRVGDIELDPVTRTVRRGGAPVRLSSRQFDLLLVLMNHAGVVLSRHQIEALLPAGGRERGSNVVEVHVHHLRRKLGAGHLSTVRGLGYVLRCERTGSDATERTLRE